MAKYTELLIEYLEDNELPSKFSEISGFEDIFINKFCDHEIGFETEDLFKVKIQNITDIYFDIYKQRISDIASAYTSILNPIKTIYTTDDLGKTKIKQTDLPIDDEEAEAKNISESDEVTNKREIKTNGLSADELVRVVEILNGQIKVVIEELLNKYKNCFMGIY